jgi:flagellar protein FliO/FliZ
MDLGHYLQFALALLVVLGVIGLLSIAIRRFGVPGLAMRPRSRGDRRIEIIDAAPVDARRRLVLVRRDRTEHLLLLGPTGDVVVETGIAAATTALPPSQGNPS